MTRPFADIHVRDWVSIAKDQPRWVWWGLAWTVLFLGVLILILLVAASQASGFSNGGSVVPSSVGERPAIFAGWDQSQAVA
jgi:hypothetical protein